MSASARHPAWQPGGAATVRSRYWRDAMGRVTDYLEYTAGYNLTYDRTASYNARSQVTSDMVTSVRGGITVELR